MSFVNFEATNNLSILTTGTDLSGSANTTYTPNGYTLINTNPYYFVRSGRVDGSTFYDFTWGADYWSSTAVDSTLAYYLSFSSGGVWPAYRLYRSSGWSLRCVADLSFRNKNVIIKLAQPLGNCAMGLD
ncbi:hypothetical protein IKF86_01660 [Candidatus Saccharibacteria bacterium]|nr:hypothetical protein [Candidatus Saccharibacteria bacterium]